MFIVFEGGDRVGKTTAIETTAKLLRADGYDVTTISESGDPTIQYIKQSDLGIETIVDLFDDVRTTHQDLISNFIDDDKIVLWDRYYDSTYVYGFRSIHESDNDAFLAWRDHADQFLSPDLTFYLHASVDVIKSRTGDDVDRFTNSSDENILKYMNRYRDLYTKIADVRDIVTMSVTDLEIDDVAKLCFDRIISEFS